MSEMMIEGPAGGLEAKFNRADLPEAPLVLILHPHPLYGGAMSNKVVFALHRAFHRHGFATLRINFRGVGRSRGEYDEGEGETRDALAALDWLRTGHPRARACWLAGYSFGSWVALRALMEVSGIARFVAVAPPVSLFDFSFLAPCPAPGLILHGSRDDLVPEPMVEALARRHAGLVRYHRLDGADHFFEGHMDELGRRLGAYLERPEAE